MARLIGEGAGTDKRPADSPDMRTHVQVKVGSAAPAP
jgi:hypothetical protein